MSGKPIKHALRTPQPADADALWQRIHARREPRPVRGRALWFLVPAAGALLLWLGLRQPELARSDGQSLAHLAAGAASARVALNDGSALELSPGAALETRALTAELFETELTRGKVVFDVKPHGRRTWRIRAGELLVSVLGTRFSVEREGTSVRVNVERGRVRVEGPGLPNDVRELSAGESLRAAPLARKPALAADGGTPEASKLAADGGSAQPKPAPAPSNIEALLRAADQARAAHQPRRAAQLLTRAVAQHRGEPQAALAAFTLGELYLGALAAPLKAAEAFEQARQLGLPAALAEEGAARLVESYAHGGDRDAALRAAAAYRAHFPQGPRARAVERWVAAP